MRVAAAVVLMSLNCGIGAAADGDLVIPPVTYPALVRHAGSVEGFLPMEWRMEFKAQGDLNADGRDDVVLVLRSLDPDNIIDARGHGGPENFDTNPAHSCHRLRQCRGRLRSGAGNHSLVARTTEPSVQDPLDPNAVIDGGIAIRNGALKITLTYFGGDMGRMSYTFRFEKGDFRLIGFDSVNIARSQGKMTEVSINYSTRRAKRSVGSISDDDTKATWTTLPPKPLLTLKQVGDGMEFQPALK